VSLLGTGTESLSGGGELEGPEEVVGLLEVGSDGPDLVDEVFHAVDAGVLETFTLSDDRVIGEGDSRSVDFTVSSLVDKSLDGGSRGVSVGDVRLNHSDHVDGGSGHSYEHSVMELSESEELHDLLALGAQLVDTSGSNDKGDLGLSFNEVVSGLLGGSTVVDEGLVLSGVLNSVFGSVGSGGSSGGDTGGLGSGTGISSGLSELGISGGFLGDVFRNDTDPKRTKARALANGLC